MKYLVTGGAGFIGSHLTERLIKDGHTVIVLDNLSTGSRHNLATISNSTSLRFLKGDMCTDRRLPQLVAEVDGIFHLAATVGVRNILSQPLHAMRNNLESTERILALAAHAKTKILITSSSEVYGNSSATAFKESDVLHLGPSTIRRWSYASVKITEEHLALAYVFEQSLPAIVVRLFNTVGERQSSQYGMVIPTFIEQALQGKPLTIYGDGTQSRCFTYVTDVVDALVTAIETPQAVGQIMNIGSTESTTINQLADAIITKTHSSAVKKYIPYRTLAQQGYQDMPYRKPDIKLARKFLGFKPRHKLTTILERMVQARVATRQK